MDFIYRTEFEGENPVLAAVMPIFLLIFTRVLRGPYGKGLVGHCTSGHSLNPPLVLIGRRSADDGGLRGSRRLQWSRRRSRLLPGTDSRRRIPSIQSTSDDSSIRLQACLFQCLFQASFFFGGGRVKISPPQNLQEDVDAQSISCFKNRLEKRRTLQMDFFKDL